MELLDLHRMVNGFGMKQKAIWSNTDKADLLSVDKGSMLKPHQSAIFIYTYN